MRVLHVISGVEPENGGPTGALVGHCRALRSVGIDSTVVATQKSASANAVADRLRSEGTPVTLLGPTRRPFRTHPRIDEVLTTEIATHDVVHIRAVWEWIEHRAAVLSRKANKPTVWTPHGMLDRWNMQRNHWFKRACLAGYLRRDLNAAARLHVATPFEAGNVNRLKLTMPLFVQGHGLDAAAFATPIPRGRLRDRFAPGDRPLILFLGRIQHGKGLELLIPALAKMTTPATLLVAGPDRGELPPHDRVADRHARRRRPRPLPGPARRRRQARRPA